MLDEAFMPFQYMVEQILSFEDEVMDEEAGVRSYISEYSVESPIELNFAMDGEGQLRIGLTPPLYNIDTSFRPSFHTLRMRASLSESEGFHGT